MTRLPRSAVIVLHPLVSGLPEALLELLEDSSESGLSVVILEEAGTQTAELSPVVIMITAKQIRQLNFAAIVRVVERFLEVV